MSLLDSLLRREKQPEPLPQGIRPFHMTIGTASQKAFSLETDLRMLRSALIYADKVKLCSYTTSNVLSLFSYTNANTWEFLNWLEENILAFTADGQERAQQIRFFEDFKRAFRKRHPDKDDLIMINRLKSQQARHKKEMRGQYPVLTEESDIKGIQQAIKLNYLELYTFKSIEFKNVYAKHLAGEPTGDASDLIQEYVDIVSEALENRATYPLFDDTTGYIVKLGEEPGAFSISLSKKSQAKHSALATNLMNRTPDFSKVSMDKIIDIRSELRAPLTNYRKGISIYARDIQSLPWDKDFVAEADEIFIREVAPAIEELEETVKSSSSFTELFLEEAFTTKSFKDGALYFLLAKSSSLPLFVATAFGVTLPLAMALKKSLKKWQKQKEGVENQTLYFLYRLRDEVNRSQKKDWSR